MTDLRALALWLNLEWLARTDDPFTILCEPRVLKALRHAPREEVAFLGARLVAPLARTLVDTRL